MKNQKGLLILTGVFILAFFAILAVAGYLVYRQYNVPKTQLQTQQNQQNWKSYKSDEYGFEINYPNQWIIKDFPEKINGRLI